MSEGIGKAFANAIKDDASPGQDRSGRHLFQNPRRRSIFTLLSTNPCMDIGTLAARSGLSRNAVEWHLDALVKAGYVIRHEMGRGSVFYPEGLISQERIPLFIAVNSPRQGLLFRKIVSKPGLFQSQIAGNLRRSRQSVAGSIKILEAAGLVTGVADGSHLRYYPTRLLPEMADNFYKAAKDFGLYILRKLGQEGGKPPVVVKHGLDRMIVEMGYQSNRFDMEIGLNPYNTCLGC
jgi:predicted transcriptional regulator